MAALRIMQVAGRGEYLRLSGKARSGQSASGFQAFDVKP
jgi:hypothetical protein